MNVVIHRSMTLEMFLAWEERQELRHEFDGFAPMAMTGGTVAHSQIQANLLRSVGNGLLGKSCRIFGSDLKILVAGSIRYPDAFVVCSPVSATATVVTDPVVVFEILGPSTAAVDYGVKNEEYRDTPSIQRYVMLEPDRQAATVFARIGDDWVGHLISGEAILEMPEIGIEIPLAELYEGVSFNETAPVPAEASTAKP